jgi:glycine/D-amino acid oxidase-like deaminating enzyme
MIPRSFDLAVVGGGIVGAACAAEATNAGLRVALVEAANIGGGATAVGMGHIVVMDDSDAQFKLTRYSQMLWHELAPELPPDVEYDPCGTIWVAAGDDELSELTRKKDYYESRGVPAFVLDEGHLREAEPCLRPGLSGGLLVPGDAAVYPPCAARFLLERARERGAAVMAGTPVAELTESGPRTAAGDLIEAGLTINATGTWAPQLTPGIDLKKRKGHLVITDRYPGLVRHQLVELGYLRSAHSTSTDSVAFNVQPRKTGQLLIGSSRQFGADDSGVESHMLGLMLARAGEYIPELGGLSAIRAWTGFRAATPDSLPLIGPCPDNPRIYLATGHEGLGITNSLATAKLLVDQVLNRSPRISIEPYLPARVLQEAVNA